MNHKCPYCGTEMEKGILQTGGNNIIWDTKKHKILAVPSKQGISLVYHPSGCAYLENVYRCKQCNIILYQYDE